MRIKIWPWELNSILMRHIHQISMHTGNFKAFVPWLCRLKWSQTGPDYSSPQTERKNQLRLLLILSSGPSLKMDVEWKYLWFPHLFPSSTNMWRWPVVINKWLLRQYTENIDICTTITGYCLMAVYWVNFFNRCVAKGFSGEIQEFFFVICTGYEPEQWMSYLLQAH